MFVWKRKRVCAQRARARVCVDVCVCVSVRACALCVCARAYGRVTSRARVFLSECIFIFFVHVCV